jgi:hypothetical protein
MERNTILGGRQAPPRFFPVGRTIRHPGPGGRSGGGEGRAEHQTGDRFLFVGKEIHNLSLYIENE